MEQQSVFPSMDPRGDMWWVLNFLLKINMSSPQHNLCRSLNKICRFLKNNLCRYLDKICFSLNIIYAVPSTWFIISFPQYNIMRERHILLRERHKLYCGHDIVCSLNGLLKLCWGNTLLNYIEERHKLCCGNDILCRGNGIFC